MNGIALVTGGLGFIGKHLVQALLDRGHFVWNVDGLTYAADLDAANRFLQHPNYRQISLRLEDLTRLPDVDAVFHLAAESHVDNSIASPLDFVTANVVGTLRLLELIRGKEAHVRPVLIHVSTDEVYGDVPGGERGGSQPDLLRPSSPYSASKAAADHLVQAWRRTFGLRAALVRPSNCYGPGQYPEKLIPKAIRSLMRGRKIPMHGNGSQTRQWLHVEDCVRALLIVAEKGDDGEVYNILGNTETRVYDIVREVVYSYHDGWVEGGHWQGFVEASGVRPGMDIRYDVDDSKLRALGWSPTHNLWRDIPELVRLERETFRW